jgi:hypothetical protein
MALSVDMLQLMKGNTCQHNFLVCFCDLEVPVHYTSVRPVGYLEQCRANDFGVCAIGAYRIQTQFSISADTNRRHHRLSARAHNWKAMFGFLQAKAKPMLSALVRQRWLVC